MKILVTGGAGYIGSHTVLELLNAGHEVVVIDNLSNSSVESLNRVKKITDKDVVFYEACVRDRDVLDKIFTSHKIDAVIHFAGLKAVGESVSKPLKYYRNNIDSTISLIEKMAKHKVRKLIFSSSATVYGNPEKLPITEDCRVGVGITNPYGQTKFMIEQILEDITKSSNKWNIISLRYFNPVGAHESGLIGEHPNGIPNNLLPYVSKVAFGHLDKVTVHGGDYETPDGTGVRDYIHVVDLAKAHLAALDNIDQSNEYKAYNIGTGNGVSVLEIIDAFRDASKKEIKHIISDRRPGDIAACYADPTLARKELGWFAEKTLKDACADSWRWQSNNPNGYK